MRGAVLLRQPTREADGHTAIFVFVDRDHLAGGGLSDAGEDRDVLDRFTLAGEKAFLSLDDAVGTGKQIDVETEAVVAKRNGGFNDPTLAQCLFETCERGAVFDVPRIGCETALGQIGCFVRAAGIGFFVWEFAEGKLLYHSFVLLAFWCSTVDSMRVSRGAEQKNYKSHP